MGASGLIRRARSQDRRALFEVCLRTGDHGGDAAHLYPGDPEALGRIYVGPYLDLQPELALALEDEQGVCGYALAAADSRTFYAAYDERLRPQLCQQFPDPVGPADRWTPQERVYHLYHHPRYHMPEPYDDFPAHLHIDLLARVQRRGFGTQMMQRLLASLEQLALPGVHLEMGAWNTRALAFYRTLGFALLEQHGDATTGVLYLGRRLG